MLDTSMTNEAEGLRRAREGDLAAFNELVLQHQGLVFSVCLRILGQQQAAEDATQDAFIAAWRGIGGLRGAFRPWLLRIATNACTDELRRRGRRPAASLETALEEGAPEPFDPEPSPEARALGSERRQHLEAALQVLPEDQRIALVLCDIEGLDYGEIAAAMQTSVGTVKSRISRGRARMRQILQATGELLPERYRQE